MHGTPDVPVRACLGPRGLSSDRQALQPRGCMCASHFMGVNIPIIPNIMQLWLSPSSKILDPLPCHITCIRGHNLQRLIRISIYIKTPQPSISRAFSCQRPRRGPRSLLTRPSYCSIGVTDGVSSAELYIIIRQPGLYTI